MRRNSWGQADGLPQKISGEKIILGGREGCLFGLPPRWLSSLLPISFTNQHYGCKIKRMVTVKIELFYFEGCPSLEPALHILNQILAEEEVEAPVVRINVDSEELVKKHRFLGSPSIQINGQDIEIDSRSATDFGQKCRIYDNDGVPSGIPPKSMIKRAVRDAKGNHSCCG